MVLLVLLYAHAIGRRFVIVFFLSLCYNQDIIEVPEGFNVKGYVRLGSCVVKI